MRLMLVAVLLLSGVCWANGARQYYEDQISMESIPRQETVVRPPQTSGGRQLSHELASIKDKINARRANFGARIRTQSALPEDTESSDESSAYPVEPRVPDIPARRVNTWSRRTKTQLRKEDSVETESTEAQGGADELLPEKSKTEDEQVEAAVNEESVVATDEKSNSDSQTSDTAAKEGETEKESGSEADAEDDKPFEMNDDFVNSKRIPVEELTEEDSSTESAEFTESERNPKVENSGEADDELVREASGETEEDEEGDVEEDEDEDVRSDSSDLPEGEDTDDIFGVPEAIEGSRAFQRRLLDLMVSEAREVLMAALPDRAAMKTFQLLPLFKPKYKGYDAPKKPKRKKPKQKKVKPSYGPPSASYGAPASDGYQGSFSAGQASYSASQPAYPSAQPAQPAYPSAQSGYPSPQPNAGPTYADPSTQTSYSAPKPVYEAPKPTYEAPKPAYEPPKSTYGAPKGKPKPTYGAPKPVIELPKLKPIFNIPKPTLKPSYGAPKPAAPKPTYGAPSKPKPTYGVPAPAPTYGAPAPKPTYGAPAPKPTYGAPKPTYPAPQPAYPAPPSAPLPSNTPAVKRPVSPPVIITRPQYPPPPAPASVPSDPSPYGSFGAAFPGNAPVPSDPFSFSSFNFDQTGSNPYIVPDDAPASPPVEAPPAGEEPRPSGSLYTGSEEVTIPSVAELAPEPADEPAPVQDSVPQRPYQPPNVISAAQLPLESQSEETAPSVPEVTATGQGNYYQPRPNKYPSYPPLYPPYSRPTTAPPPPPPPSSTAPPPPPTTTAPTTTAPPTTTTAAPVYPTYPTYTRPTYRPYSRPTYPTKPPAPTTTAPPPTTTAPSPTYPTRPSTTAPPTVPTTTAPPPPPTTTTAYPTYAPYPSYAPPAPPAPYPTYAPPAPPAPYPTYAPPAPPAPTTTAPPATSEPAYPPPYYYGPPEEEEEQEPEEPSEEPEEYPPPEPEPEPHAPEEMPEMTPPPYEPPAYPEPTQPESEEPAYKELPPFNRQRPKQKPNRQQVKNREQESFFNRFQEPFSPQQFNDFFGSVPWPAGEGFPPYSSSFGNRAKSKPGSSKKPTLEPIGPADEEEAEDPNPFGRQNSEKGPVKSQFSGPLERRKGSSRRTGAPSASRRLASEDRVDPNIANHAVAANANGGVQYQPRPSVRRPSAFRDQTSWGDASAAAQVSRRERKRNGNRRLANRRVEQQASEE